MDLYGFIPNFQSKIQISTKNMPYLMVVVNNENILKYWSTYKFCLSSLIYLDTEHLIEETEYAR